MSGVAMGGSVTGSEDGNGRWRTCRDKLCGAVEQVRRAYNQDPLVFKGMMIGVGTMILIGIHSVWNRGPIDTTAVNSISIVFFVIKEVIKGGVPYSWVPLITTTVGVFRSKNTSSVSAQDADRELTDRTYIHTALTEQKGVLEQQISVYRQNLLDTEKSINRCRADSQAFTRAQEEALREFKRSQAEALQEFSSKNREEEQALANKTKQLTEALQVTQRQLQETEEQIEKNTEIIQRSADAVEKDAEARRLKAQSARTLAQDKQKGLGNNSHISVQRAEGKEEKKAGAGKAQAGSLPPSPSRSQVGAGSSAAVNNPQPR